MICARPAAAQNKGLYAVGGSPRLTAARDSQQYAHAQLHRQAEKHVTCGEPSKAQKV